MNSAHLTAAKGEEQSIIRGEHLSQGGECTQILSEGRIESHHPLTYIFVVTASFLMRNHKAASSLSACFDLSNDLGR